jgi:pyrimidine-nucleoside phosphorylase
MVQNKSTQNKWEDEIDMTAGIYLYKKAGDIVKAGDVLATVYGNDENKVKAAADELAKAYVIGDDRPERRRLIHKVIGL